MPIQRVSVENGDGESTWTEPDMNGDYVYWDDIAEVIVSASALIARVELAHDLHAVFKIKDSEEYKKLKLLVASATQSQ